MSPWDACHRSLPGRSTEAFVDYERAANAIERLIGLIREDDADGASQVMGDFYVGGQIAGCDDQPGG